MKKIVLGCFFALSILVFLSACSKQKEDETAANASGSNDTVVLINGVKWATRNVATPGTFATNPQDAGSFYYWNSKVIDDSPGAFNSGEYSSPSSDTWTIANDPSPIGWRVPTCIELETLFDTTKVKYTWTTQNGIYGGKFTDKTTGNSIFLPATNKTKSIGLYWSSTAKDKSNRTAYDLHFGTDNYVDVYWDSWQGGTQVRPVLK